MVDYPTATKIVEVTTDLVRLKAEMLKPAFRRSVRKEFRKAVAKRVHVAQTEETEKEVADVVEGVLMEQVQDIARGLKPLKGNNPAKLMKQAGDPEAVRVELVDQLLPILAIKMAEAAVSQMIQIGVDPRRKKEYGGSQEKHLPGKHNQSSHGRGGGVPSRSELAKRTHKPSTKEKQQKGEAEQARLAKLVGGENTDDNLAFDVIVGGRAGVEVKTVMDNNNDKITVHPKSRRRKEAVAKENGYSIHLVAIDVRGGKRAYSYRNAVGAFRLKSMERVTIAQLKERLMG